MKWEKRLKTKRNQKWNEKWNEKQNQIKSKIKNEIKNKNNLKVKLNWKNNLGTKRASWPRCANENWIEFKKQLWDETCHPGRDVPWDIRISKKNSLDETCHRPATCHGWGTRVLTIVVPRGHLFVLKKPLQRTALPGFHHECLWPSRDFLKNPD